MSLYDNRAVIMVSSREELLALLSKTDDSKDVSLERTYILFLSQPSPAAKPRLEELLSERGFLSGERVKPSTGCLMSPCLNDTQLDDPRPEEPLPDVPLWPQSLALPFDVNSEAAINEALKSVDDAQLIVFKADCNRLEELMYGDAVRLREVPALSTVDGSRILTRKAIFNPLLLHEFLLTSLVQVDGSEVCAKWSGDGEARRTSVLEERKEDSCGGCILPELPTELVFWEVKRAARVQAAVNESLKDLGLKTEEDRKRLEQIIRGEFLQRVRASHAGLLRQREEEIVPLDFDLLPSLSQSLEYVRKARPGLVPAPPPPKPKGKKKKKKKKGGKKKGKGGKKKGKGGKKKGKGGKKKGKKKK